MTIRKILLVDDSPAQLIEMQNALSEVDARIITAESGNEAIEKAKSEMPDIIFMDIVMNNLDGYGACRNLTRNDQTSHIPIIFISTKNQRADKMWAEKQGAKALITKPFKQEDLLQQIQNYS